MGHPHVADRGRAHPSRSREGAPRSRRRGSPGARACGRCSNSRCSSPSPWWPPTRAPRRLPSTGCSIASRAARTPRRPVQAVALAAGFSMAAGYLNWAFGLVGSALFVPFILKRNPRADVRLVIAAAYMGIGTVWQSGLSSSAPLILATPGNPLLEPGTGAPIVDRLYPVTETLFHPFNLGYAVAMLLVGLVAAMALHPRRDVVTLTESEGRRDPPRAPAPRREGEDARRAARPLPRLVAPRRRPVRVPARALDRHPRLRRELDDQRLQHRVSRPRPSSSTAARRRSCVPAATASAPRGGSSSSSRSTPASSASSRTRASAAGSASSSRKSPRPGSTRSWSTSIRAS